MERWTPKEETAVLKEKDASAIAGPGGKFVPVLPQSVAAQLLLVSGAALLD